MSTRSLAKGDTLRQRRAGVTHTYTVTGFQHYILKSGRSINLLLLRGRCVTCGREFTATAKKSERYIARTCKRHRGKYRANGSGVSL